MLLGCGLVTLGAYMAVGAPFYFWYAPPPTVAVLLSAFFGLAISGVLRWALGPLLVFLLVAGVQAAPKVEHMQTHDAAVFANVGLTLRADAAGQPATVMLEPIGIVGYTSGLRVLDEVGLVTPWIAREREHGDGWYARVIRRERPEYVVIRRDWLEGGVAWAGLGRPFASRAQADSVLVGYAPLRVRHGEGPPPPGAGKLVVLRRK
jgi:hypothetical protein